MNHILNPSTAALKVFNFLTAFILLLTTNASETSLYPKVKIPPTDTIVYNFSVYIKPYTNWKASDSVVTYTLMGYNKSAKKWISVFGGGKHSNTPIKLSNASATRVNVVVPRFDTNVIAYNLQIMQPISNSGFNQFGLIPLKTETYSNNGSIPGNTYTLIKQPSSVTNLIPNGTAKNAVLKPSNPPKLDTLTVNGQKRKVFYVWNETASNYETFFVRGMCYESTPVGQLSTMNGAPSTVPGETVYLADFNKSGGGQICQTITDGPFGSSVSYCFDTDLSGYMHQYLNNTSLGGFADTANALLKSRWERDFKIMNAMGVNTIRIYHHDALVRNMTDFLDIAYQYGIYVIMPAPAPNSSQTFETSPKTGRLQTYEQLTSADNPGQSWSALMQLMLVKYAAHPAILAWAVGNETEADNANQAAAEIEWLLAKTIKDFDSNILVTATNQDHYNSTKNFKDFYNVFLKDTNSTDTYLDFYAINSYRGISPNSLELGGMETLFEMLDNLEAPYDLPLLVSEWGKNDNYSFSGTDNQFGFNRLWRLFLQRKSNLLGVSYFEFSDEPVAKNLAGQHYMGVTAYSLNENYSANGPIQINRIIPKFKDYKGILNISSTGDTLQYYPAVAMAGIFDSFIGDNSNALIKDSSIVMVPNLSYCAFNQSPSPWKTHQKCFIIDAEKKKSKQYQINVTPGGSDVITGITLNGKSFTNGEKADSTGIIKITLKSSDGVIGNIQMGFNAIGDLPASNNNTLLYNNLGGTPIPSWNSTYSKLSIPLPPVSN